MIMEHAVTSEGRRARSRGLLVPGIEERARAPARGRAPALHGAQGGTNEWQPVSFPSLPLLKVATATLAPWIVQPSHQHTNNSASTNTPATAPQQ
jgi:hypothetical protein